jgi:hypothetical protein
MKDKHRRKATISFAEYIFLWTIKRKHMKKYCQIWRTKRISTTTI